MEQLFNSKYYGKNPSEEKIEAVNNYLGKCKAFKATPMQVSVLANKNFTKIWDNISTLVNERISQLFGESLAKIKNEHLRRKIRTTLRYLYDADIYVTVEDSAKLLAARNEDEIIREYKIICKGNNDYVPADCVKADFKYADIYDYNEEE